MQHIPRFAVCTARYSIIIFLAGNLLIHTKRFLIPQIASLQAAYDTHQGLILGALALGLAVTIDRILCFIDISRPLRSQPFIRVALTVVSAVFLLAVWHESLLFCLLLAFAAGGLYASRQLEYRDTTRLMSFDEPIHKADQDLLDRGGIATDILSKLTAPGLRCPRVALVGPVGSGKTSVANLVAERARIEGHATAVFDPWHFSSPEEAELALVWSIAECPTSYPQGEWTPRWRARLSGVKALSELVASRHPWALHLIHPIHNLLHSGRRELQRRIRNDLPQGKQLIVLVDDLERCTPKIQERILVNAREILDVPGLSFLFTFDRQRLTAPPSSPQTEAPDDPAIGSLLAKVFDYQLLLPQPHTDDLSRIDAAFLEQLRPKSSPPTMKEINPLLPTEPRERKRFLAHTCSWRVDIWDHPVHLDRTYLFALLLLEHYCIGALHWILETKQCLHDLQSGSIRDGAREAFAGEQEGGAVDNFIAGAPWSGIQSAEATYQHLRDSMPLLDVEAHVRWLLGGEASAEEVFVTRAASKIRDGGSTEECSKELAGQPAPALASLRRLRDHLLAYAADEPAREMQQHYVCEAVSCSRQRRRILDEQSSSSSFLTPSEVSATILSLQKWQGWGGDYRRSQEEEWDTLQSLMKWLRKSLSLGFRCWLECRSDMPAHLHAKASRSIYTRSYKQLEDIACDYTMTVLQRTKLQPDRDSEHAIIAEYLIARPESDLIGGSKRRKMLDLLKDDHRVPWENVWAIWSVMFSGVKKGPIDRDLYRDREFIGVLWRRVTEKALNPRWIQELRRNREAIVGQDVNEGDLPIPDDWEGTIEDYTRIWTP